MNCNRYSHCNTLDSVTSSFTYQAFTYRQKTQNCWNKHYQKSQSQVKMECFLFLSFFFSIKKKKSDFCQLKLFIKIYRIYHALRPKKLLHQICLCLGQKSQNVNFTLTLLKDLEMYLSYAFLFFFFFFPPPSFFCLLYFKFRKITRVSIKLLQSINKVFKYRYFFPVLGSTGRNIPPML